MGWAGFRHNALSTFLCGGLQRFGRLMQLWISALMLFNMGIAMTAEYTAVGSLFTDVIGTTQVPIVIIIGVVSSLYTAYGGLYASIITDQWQVRFHVLWSPTILPCSSFYPFSL